MLPPKSTSLHGRDLVHTSSDPGRRLLTIREAAVRLGCSEANVYALRASGELPFVPIGVRKGYRVDVLDIDAFIERRKEQRLTARSKVPRPRLKHIRLP